MISFGLLFYQINSENHKSYINTQVNSYQKYIKQYAVANNIGEYTLLLEAIMMQESGGLGTDPMQSSECEYNTKYPKYPGAITDPIYSIEVGVKYFRKCLNLAHVRSTNDNRGIYLALQGYNYGTGYITWALENYEGYSYENAKRFSNIQKIQNQTSTYGDPLYVKHVLRYYDSKMFEAWKRTYD